MTKIIDSKYDYIYNLTIPTLKEIQDELVEFFKKFPIEYTKSGVYLGKQDHYLNNLPKLFKFLNTLTIPDPFWWFACSIMQPSSKISAHLDNGPINWALYIPVYAPAGSILFFYDYPINDDNTWLEEVNSIGDVIRWRHIDEKKIKLLSEHSLNEPFIFQSTQKVHGAINLHKSELFMGITIKISQNFNPTMIEHLIKER